MRSEAIGYAVYIGVGVEDVGQEILQAVVDGFDPYYQTSPLVNGYPLPTINNSGLPDPLVIPTVSAVPGYPGGTLPMSTKGVYFIRIAWRGPNGTTSLASPGAANWLNTDGALVITPPPPPPSKQPTPEDTLILMWPNAGRWF